MSPLPSKLVKVDDDFSGHRSIHTQARGGASRHAEAHRSPSKLTPRAAVNTEPRNDAGGWIALRLSASRTRQCARVASRTTVATCSRCTGRASSGATSSSLLRPPPRRRMRPRQSQRGRSRRHPRRLHSKSTIYMVHGWVGRLEPAEALMRRTARTCSRIQRCSATVLQRSLRG